MKAERFTLNVGIDIARLWCTGLCCFEYKFNGKFPDRNIVSRVQKLHLCIFYFLLLSFNLLISVLYKLVSLFFVQFLKKKKRQNR